MEDTVTELREIIDAFSDKFRRIPKSEFVAKPLPHKWSRQEVLGHLIDSAQNNLRRFICGQYEAEPPGIFYQQDFWVSANGYQNMRQEDVILLWRLLNLRICAVLELMPVENYSRECYTDSLHSLEWLAADYVKHMKHHINQIISGSFNVVYT